MNVCKQYTIYRFYFLLINIFLFLLHYLFYYYFIYFVLTVISENGQIISIITDYECVTCHRIFQSEDVSQKLIFF